jgi:hypothetical protein
MTYSILLVVKRPDEHDNWKENNRYNDEYNALVNTLKQLPQDGHIQLLAENTVLLRLDQGLQGVLNVLKALRSLPYTYTILPEDTKWYEATNKV